MKSAAFALLLATACGVAAVGVSSQTVPRSPSVGSGETPRPGVLRLGDAPGRWVPFEASMIRIFRAERVWLENCTERRTGLLATKRDRRLVA